MKLLKQLKVYISGPGSEFNQGFISKNDYNEWIENKEMLSQTYSVIQISLWNQFCINHLGKDGYWDINDVSAFTALRFDQAFIEIYIEDKLFFSGKILDLMSKHFDEDEITKSKNISKDYGKSFLPEDWDNFFTLESFNKRNKKLVTTLTTENFEVNEKAELKSSFDINKFGLLVVATDEMGYGIDYGDYIIGFTYDNSDVYFEFPGGVGQLDSPDFN
tara:strand:- start:1503 stop:2156 length:654 start_codon:yes stop_codon:yes gene_type:complete